MQVRHLVSIVAQRVALIALAILRGSLSRLPVAERRGFASQLIEAACKADYAQVFDLAQRSTVSDINDLDVRQQMLATACAGFHPGTMPTALIESFLQFSGGALYYSQEGEDVLLGRLFSEHKNGFYVDIGAHHAVRFSNTFALYQRGWRGINIDASPGSMDSFKRWRPADTNVEAAVSDSSRPLTLHVFKEGALNTLDAKLADSYAAKGWIKIGTVELQPQRMADLLDQHVPAGQGIDLLSVDVEGAECAVLRSNNWAKYSPKAIIIEALDASMTSLATDAAISFLAEHGFVPVSRLFNSVILLKSK